MKEKYPRYEKGELVIVEKKLPKKDKEVLEKFLKKCSITAGEKKVIHIKRLVLQLTDVTEIPLTKQNQESIDSFLVLLSNSDKSVWTKDELKVYIKQFLLWFYKDLELVSNFKAESKKGLNPKINENNLITKQEIEQMLRHAESYKERAYLLLAFETGARPQELIDLKWKDIKFEEEYADVNLFSTKTKTSRTFPIVRETMKALWEWKEHYPYEEVSPKDYIFPSRWRDRPLTTAGLNKILRRMAKSSGIQKDVWGYLLRHSQATRLYESLPQQICEKLLGHKNMAGTYAHISSKKAREEMLKKVHKIESFPDSERESLKKENEQLKSIVKKIKSYEDTIVFMKKFMEEHKSELSSKLSKKNRP